jgi:flagellar protein FlaJ
VSFERYYVNLSEQMAGGIAADIEGLFTDLKSHLIMADMGFSLHEYLSMMVFSTGFIFFVTAPSISVIVGVLNGTLYGAIAGVITGLFIGVLLASGTFIGFYTYPKVQVGQRRSDIQNNLPFATMYLSTIAGTGTPPAALFDLLGQFEEYGEVSREAEKISRDIQTFGADATHAIRGAAQRTPSDEFQELLWGMNSIITTGGDLREYLQQKAKSYMQDYRRRLDKFTDTLSLLVEMYITLVIVGSIFLVIISTIMSAFGQNPALIVGIQLFTVFILLPLAGVMFIVIVKGVSPLE